MTKPLIVMTKQYKAMLDMIATTEGTKTHPLTKQDGYDVIVTGIDGAGRKTPEIFGSYAFHPFDHGRPPKPINKTGLASTASGRYQILLRFWRHYRDANGWPEFSPLYQDQYALVQFRERGILKMLDQFKFHAALAAISSLWASLPGKGYVGQGQRSVAYCETAFTLAGGIILDSATPKDTTP